jgi:hypothetical protein
VPITSSASSAARRVACEDMLNPLDADTASCHVGAPTSTLSSFAQFLVVSAVGSTALSSLQYRGLTSSFPSVVVDLPPSRQKYG